MHMQIPAAGQRPAASEAEQLWLAWKERGDSRARDRLVLLYSPMVRYIAARKVRELPSHLEQEDLVSCGLLALVSAVDRFDPTKGATFEQFAWTRVAGAVVDELRRQDWASRSARRLGKEVERTRERLLAKTGEQPTEAAVAAELKITVAEVRERVGDVERAELVSLNAPTRSGEDGTREVGDLLPADGRANPEAAVLAGERASVFRDGIRKLSERERLVLELVYVHQLQGVEIGRELGVSESRVSQILSGARAKLRRSVEAYDAGAIESVA